MSNILYLGPYRENTGLGRSSRRWLKCLTSDSSNNICSRPIYPTQNTQFHDTEIFDFTTENTMFNKYDYIIQHGPPDMFIYDKRFGKNIGIIEIETDNIYHSGWVEKINILDEVVVGSSVAKMSLEHSGVKIPIKIIPEPYDNYTSNNQDNFFGSNPKYQTSYIFYTIGQYFEKKNILGIVLSFLLEFDENDDVQLFIKTGDYYQSNENLEKIIKHDIANIHNAVKRHAVKDNRVDILCGLLTDNDIYRLHKSCNCYVNAVKSDANGACVIEAKLHNNTVINTDGVGSSDYINAIQDFLVESIDTNVYSRDYYNHKTFTIHEKWKEPNIHSIRQCMRQAYENRENQNLNLFDSSVFSYANTLGKLL